MKFNKNLSHLKSTKALIELELIHSELWKSYKLCCLEQEWKTFSIRQQVPIQIFQSCEHMIYRWSDGFKIWSWEWLPYKNSTSDK